MKLTAILMVLLLLTIIPSISHAQSYSMRMYTNKENYLDTDTVYANYVAYGSDGKVLPGGEGTWYLNSSLNNTPIASGNISGSHGEFSIALYTLNLTAVGAGADFNLVLVFTYEGESVKTSQSIWIADSHFLMFQVHAYPETPGYHPGSMITIEVISPVPDEPVKYIAIYHNTALWNNITGLHLDLNGQAIYNFRIPDTWKNGDFVNIVVVIENSTASTSFTVGIWHNLHLKISSKYSEIISGDKITIQLEYTNISSPYFHFYVQVGNTVLYRFFTASNTIQYQVPYNFSGYLNINCLVFNSSEKIGAVNTVLDIKYATLKIQLDKMYYSDDDNLNIYAEFRSNVINTPTFVYSIYAYSGYSYNLVEKIITPQQKISFHIPNNAPKAYMISVLAYDKEHSVESIAKINYVIPVNIEANIITQSSYATSAYTPGEKIEIHYSITGIRSTGFLYYGFGNKFYTNPHIIRITNNCSGDISIIIPDDIKKGIYTIHIKLITDDASREIGVPVFVDNNPPWSQYLIFTIPAADFLTLILVGAGLVALALYLKPEKNKPTPKKEKEKTSESGKESL